MGLESVAAVFLVCLMGSLKLSSYLFFFFCGFDGGVLKYKDFVFGLVSGIWCLWSKLKIILGFEKQVASFFLLKMELID